MSVSLDAEPQGDGDGFVFATTGALYTDMARRAVRNLRQVMPDAAVDLFTDQEIVDDAFDRIVPVGDSWFRPKMEALRRSRFERTVYLDSDCVVVNDVGDIFEILRRFDFTAVQHMRRNWPVGRMPTAAGAPRAFPQFVGAVVGIRRNPLTAKLMEDWERTMRETQSPKDQPVLRDLLWDSDLRIHVLPFDYNVHTPAPTLPWMDSSNAAPKILHYSKLQKLPAGNPEAPFDLRELCGPSVARHIERLNRSDAALGGDPSRIVPAMTYSLRSSVRRLWGKRLRPPYLGDAHERS